MPRLLRVIQRNALVYRRVWRGTLFSTFAQPSLFLIAIGVNVGAYVDRAGGALPGNIGFLQFVAPGLLAASCMQIATFESTYPIAAKLTWRRNYDAILATPLEVLDLVLGELGWIGLRLTTAVSAFTVVMMACGVPASPMLIPAALSGVLTGMAFSAPIMAYAGTRKSNGDFNVLFRFVITPLFMFSGVFFPIARLPGPLPQLAWLTPLFHGVELVRGLTLGTLTLAGGVLHAAYLALMIVAGVWAAARTFTRRLHP